jgi:hypothetical protein
MRRKKMEQKQSQYTGYILAASLGAIGEGLLVAAITKAIPKMMSQMMTGMMAEMECDPAEI